MILTFILLGGLVTLLIYYYWTLKLFYKYFERRNIPGPPPKLFFGHYLSLWSTPLFARQIPEWTQQYGSIYGIFQGTTPIYIVSNVDFLQEVFIKQFSIFHSRPLNFLIKMIRARAAPSLFTSPANHWRRQRHIINPTFSATKLKMMNPLIHKCIYSLMNKLDQQKQNEFNIFVLYKRLTLDVICKLIILFLTFQIL